MAQRDPRSNAATMLPLALTLMMAIAGAIVGCSSQVRRDVRVGSTPAVTLGNGVLGSEMEIGLPGSVADLVRGPEIFANTYSVIVVGVVTEVLGTGIFATPSGVPLEHSLDVGPYPYIDFLLNVEQIFLNDGDLEVDSPLILRTYYDDDPRYPLEKIGDRYLWFLNRMEEPRDTAVGAYLYDVSGWLRESRLVVDEDDVAFSDEGHTRIDFAVGTPPAAFLEAVATEAARQYR